MSIKIPIAFLVPLLPNLTMIGGSTYLQLHNQSLLLVKWLVAPILRYHMSFTLLEYGVVADSDLAKNA